MADPNIIAYLLMPESDEEHLADISMRLPANMNRWRNREEQPSWTPQTDLSDRSVASGGRTPSPERSPRHGPLNIARKNKLQLDFRNEPKKGRAFVIGRDPNRCDILLLDAPGISQTHCCITFDETGRLIVKNLSTSSGTAVTFDRATRSKTIDDLKRKDPYFTWIVEGHPGANEPQNNIEIWFAGNLSLRLFVPNRGEHADSYLDNVRRSRESLGFGALGIGNPNSLPQTAAPSRPSSPPRGPIYATMGQDGQIATGAFGFVEKCWDVSTGILYALKRPRPMAGINVEDKVTNWKREIAILKKINHEYIVRYHDEREETVGNPLHSIILEYIQGGNLLTLDPPLEYLESLDVLDQSLSALHYLHSNDVAHRDLKPANILVEQRNSIKIKLGDFGYAKEGSLGSYVGTRTFQAPEVDSRSPYYVTADLWSLGVTMLALIYGLQSMKDWSTQIPEKEVRKSASCISRDAYCKHVEEFCGLNRNEFPDDTLINLLAEGMVIYNYRERWSAKLCLSERGYTVRPVGRWLEPHLPPDPLTPESATRRVFRGRVEKSRSSLRLKEKAASEKLASGLLRALDRERY